MSTITNTSAAQAMRVVVTTRVPPDLHERLRQIAEDEDRSVSTVIRRALMVHVRDYPERGR